MKIIHRYIIREFIESFIFGLIVFSSILLLDQLFQLVDLFLSKGIAVWIVLKLFMLILPNIFSLAIPMAVLIGILLAYGRLSEDNEITAFRATGLSYRSFTSPVIVFIFLLSLFLIYFNQDLSPRTHRQFRNIYQEILTQRPLVKFEEKAIVKVDNYRIYVEKIDKQTNTLRGVNIYRFADEDKGIPWRISASSAAVSVTPEAVVFTLYSGYLQKPAADTPDGLLHINFNTYRFSIPLATKSALPFSQSLREMTGAQIRKEIGVYRQKKLPINFLENEYWLRFSLALAPFVLGIVGIPLGIITEKGGKSIGFGLSLVVLFVYYLLLVSSMNLGEKGIAPPWIIMWLPDTATLAAGVVLWRRMLRK